MQAEKVQINFSEGVDKGELIIRELQEENVLPVLEPLKLNLGGTIGSVFEFLTKRVSEKDQVDQKRSHIIVDRENLSIRLVIAENDARFTGSITGSLSYHPKYVEFGINTGKTWEPQVLSKFIKMNQAFFSDRAYNMELVTILKNFKANIDLKVEKMKEDNGSRADNFSQVVSSNLPSAFKLQIPIFKGRAPEFIEVELLADVNGREVFISLCSPGAEVIVEEERNKAIDEQLDLIRELSPDIAIIEK